MSVTVIAALTLVTGFSLGAWLSERSARSAFVNAQAEAIRQVVLEVTTAHLTEIAQAAKTMNRMFGGETTFVQPGVVPPPPSPEQKALDAYTSESLEMIRRGLADEMGLSGMELEMAMSEVRRTFAENEALV